MVDSNLITVTNNENPVIEVEISYLANETEVKFLQSKGDKGDTGDTGPVFDWVGTSAEYSAALANGTITENTVCYITDDASIIDLETFATVSDLNEEISRAQSMETSLQEISHTHINKTALDNVSGTNTGDESATTIKSKLGITTLSGSNTGDQDLSGYVTTASLNSHTSNTSNPHIVTATQIGAPTISSGTSSPTSTPSKVGDIYVDTANIKTYVAKGTSSTADWIKQNGCYSLQGFCGSSTLTANSTKYFGTLFTRTFDSADNSCKIIIPKSGTITNVTYSSFIATTLGSNEAVNLYIRVNSTTSYLVSNSLTFNAADKKYVVDGLSIPVSKGDYMSFQLVTPAFSTTPVGVFSNAVALVEE